ncbi:MAG: hypothetical protein FWG90_06770 [Oscillospiraceae bacterium]|nr:hypothetical protein [Oscillospiraceae bacterium]
MTEKNSCFKEAVCVEVQRIFDSCSERDGIFDLPVRLNNDSPKITDDMDIAKVRCAEVEITCINVDPVMFKSGYYAVDITYRFNIIAEVFTSDPCKHGVTVCGCAVWNKKVILYGGCSNTKTFTSEMELKPSKPEHCSKQSCKCPDGTLPKATVKVIEPIALDAKLVCLPQRNCRIVCKCECVCSCDPCRCGQKKAEDCCETGVPCHCDPCAKKECKKGLVVSLGLFSIVQLSRPVSIIVPAYDYVLPSKKCTTNECGTGVSPCDIFEKIEFPADRFFPNCDAEPNILGAAAADALLEFQGMGERNPCCD